jgi:phosphoribosylformimino-5-aminoimidazole carboxamide ribotide isomerase
LRTSVYEGLIDDSPKHRRPVKIIPVIDLKGGVVVHGIAGRRDSYRPIQSTVARNCMPRTVAAAFAALGLPIVYVADLDAIAGAPPCWDAYERIAESGLKLWVDAGVGDSKRLRDLADRSAAAGRLAGVIAGLETLPDVASLDEWTAIVGSDRLIFSLDLQAGRPMTAAGDMKAMSPIEIATLAAQAGVRRMIVLDVARVGIGDGTGTEDVCREIHSLRPDLELIGGGGIRGLADLEALAAAGCTGALVASALHDGRIGPEEIRAAHAIPRP